MFITLSHVQNGEPVLLNPVLDNREGGMEVALCEILYYPAWVNFAESLGNNIFHYGQNEIQIPDGYWDVCALNKEIFEPFDLKLSMNPATGRISISGIGESYYLDLGSVGNTLGFVNLVPPVVNGRVVAERFPNLIIHKELYIHLSGLSTYENRHNALPSQLLRAIPIGQEECNGGRQVTFTIPYFKRMETGTHSQIEVSVRTEDGSDLKLAYLSLVLQIRRIPNGRS